MLREDRVFGLCSHSALAAISTNLSYIWSGGSGPESELGSRSLLFVNNVQEERSFLCRWVKSCTVVPTTMYYISILYRLIITSKKDEFSVVRIVGFCSLLDHPSTTVLQYVRSWPQIKRDEDKKGVDQKISRDRETTEV